MKPQTFNHLSCFTFSKNRTQYAELYIILFYPRSKRNKLYSTSLSITKSSWELYEHLSSIVTWHLAWQNPWLKLHAVRTVDFRRPFCSVESCLATRKDAMQDASLLFCGRWIWMICMLDVNQALKTMFGFKLKPSGWLFMAKISNVILFRWLKHEIYIYIYIYIYTYTVYIYSIHIQYTSNFLHLHFHTYNHIYIYTLIEWWWIPDSLHLFIQIVLVSLLSSLMLNQDS